MACGSYGKSESLGVLWVEWHGIDYMALVFVVDKTVMERGQ